MEERWTLNTKHCMYMVVHGRNKEAVLKDFSSFFPVEEEAKFCTQKLLASQERSLVVPPQVGAGSSA